MENKDKFEIRIGRFSTVRRAIINWTSAFVLSFKAMSALVIGLLLLSGIIPNAFVNLTLFVLLALLLLAMPIVFVKNYKRFENFMKEAFKMEALMGNLNSRIISALDFIKEKEPSSLKLIVISQAEKDMELEFENKLSRIEFKKRLKMASGMALICAISLFFLAGPMTNNIKKSWNDAYNILYPVTYVLTPDASKTHIHSLNEEVNITIEFNRDSMKEVTLLLQAGEDKPEKININVVNQKASYTLTSNIQKEYKVTFEFAEQQSETLNFVFTTNPILENMQVELIYPSYTRQLPKSLEGIIQRVVGLTGTRVTFGFTFSKDISRATITWDDGSEDLDLDVVGRFASISLIHTKNRAGSLQVTDIHGLQMETPLTIFFNIQNDEKPEIKLPKFITQNMPMKISEAKMFTFGVRLEDDFGVQRCLLSWKKTSVDNPNAIKERGEIERIITPPRRKSVVEFSKVFESMALVPGDKISFDIAAFDNRQPNPQSAKSSVRSFFIFRDELEGWDMKQAGFGTKQMTGKDRIKKKTKSTTVKSPDALRIQEKFLNEFDAQNTSKTKTATIRGRYQKETVNYFKLINEISSENEGE